MKKMIYGLSVVLTVCLLCSCEKENIRNISAGKKKPAITASEKAVPSITVSAGDHCGKVICNIWVGPVIRYNAINITNNNKELHPSLTYTLYERISSDPATATDVFQPFAQYTCSEIVSMYASEDVNNNKRLLVYASDPAYAAPDPNANVTLVWGSMIGKLPHSTFRTLTSGNFEGTICGGNKDE
jgi:hypothetical protein